MSVLENLTEEECYLIGILQDVSGIDIAEFAMYSAEHEESRSGQFHTDGCWRAWSFQYSWWRNKHPQQIDHAGRALGKSMGVVIRSMAFPFNYIGEEMTIVAPEKIHLTALTGKIETELKACRLTREMLVGQGGRNSFGHEPFEARFANGSKILGRIPQHDGKGLKGIHSTLLEMDEAQDLPEAAFEEAVETVLTSVEGSVQRIHGVTKGVRGYFYSYTQPGSGWHVHRIVAMDRPTWSAKEREDKILKYGGSRDDPNYRRNVYGAHGDSTQNLFVASRLIRCCDMNEDSEYNAHEYTHIRITDEILRDTDLSVEDLIDPPRDHVRSKKYLSFWCGMDIGWTIAPSEIVVFGEMMNPKKDGETIFKLLTRVSLIRVKSPEQRAAMAAIMDIYKPKVFAFDATGAGIALLHELEHNRPDLLKLIRGYNFSSKILVGIDPSVEVSQELGEDLAKEAGIMQNTQERGQDVLRELVDAQRLLLPADRGVIGQFEGGTAQTLRRPDQYGRTRVFSKGEDHCIAAGSLVMTARGEVPIEDVVTGDKVLTREGFRTVVDSRMTSPDAEIVSVTTIDGRTLFATSDHRVWSNGNWIMVKDLREGMEVVTCPTRSVSSSMESSLGDTPTPSDVLTEFTSRPVDPFGVGGSAGFMKKSGGSIMEKSPMATMSITKTATPSTMTFPTSNVSPDETTSNITPVNMTDDPRSGSNTWKESDPRPLSGTPLRPDDTGTANTPRGLGRGESLSPELVVGARRSSIPGAGWPCIAQRGVSRPTATRSLSPETVGSVGLSSSSPVNTGAATIAGITPAGRSAVYDLTIEGQPEFFANGILVHNCLDAARMFALGWSQQEVDALLERPEDEEVNYVAISF